MSDLGWNIWSTAAAVLGFAIPLGIAWFYASLPTSRLPSLVELMDETQKLFDASLRDGLFTDESDLYDFDVNIMSARIRFHEICSRVYTNPSMRQNVGNWWSGLSRKISLVSTDLNLTRVKLIERHSKELKRIASESLTKADLPLHADSQGRSMPLPESSQTPTQHPKTLLASPLPCDSPPRSHRGERNFASTHPAGSDDVLSEKSDAGGGANCLHVRTPCADLARSCNDVLARSCASYPHTSLNARPTHHCACNIDLQGVLSMILSNPLLHGGDALTNHARGVSRTATFSSDGTLPKRYHKRGARFKTLRHIIRRTYGIQQPSRTSREASESCIDLESLQPQSAEGGDDYEDWTDE